MIDNPLPRCVCGGRASYEFARHDVSCIYCCCDHCHASTPDYLTRAQAEAAWTHMMAEPVAQMIADLTAQRDAPAMVGAERGPESCASCRFAKLSINNRHKVDCRAHPPDSNGDFPYVESSEWCGEYHPKDKPHD